MSIEENVKKALSEKIGTMFSKESVGNYKTESLQGSLANVEMARVNVLRFLIGAYDYGLIESKDMFELISKSNFLSGYVTKDLKEMSYNED